NTRAEFAMSRDISGPTRRADRPASPVAPRSVVHRQLSPDVPWPLLPTDRDRPGRATSFCLPKLNKNGCHLQERAWELAPGVDSVVGAGPQVFPELGARCSKSYPLRQLLDCCSRQLERLPPTPAA